MPKLLPKLERFHQPRSLEETLEILQEAEGNTLVLGGGVSLGMIPRRSVRTVVSLEGLDLSYVSFQEDEVRLGAGLTLACLAENLARVNKPEIDVVRRTAVRTATTPLRNLMTVGGVLAGAGPWSDLPVTLLALDTVVIINGEGSISLEKLLELGPGKILTGKGIITEVRFKTNVWLGAAFDKVGRNASDLAIASAAVALHAGNGDKVRTSVALGGVAAKPVRLVSVEQLLWNGEQGTPSREELFEVLGRSVRPRSDPRAPKEYRLHLAAHLIADCLGTARGSRTS